MLRSSVSEYNWASLSGKIGPSRFGCTMLRVSSVEFVGSRLRRSKHFVSISKKHTLHFYFRCCGMGASDMEDTGPTQAEAEGLRKPERKPHEVEAKRTRIGRRLDWWQSRRASGSTARWYS